MNKWVICLNEYRKMYMWQFICLCIFFIINVLSWALSFNKYFDIVILLYSLLAFIPVILLALFFFICNKLFKKHPVLSKIISITGVLFFLILQMIYSLTYIYVVNEVSTNRRWENPRTYKGALKELKAKFILKVFPYEIPNGAKNIKVEQGSDGFIFYSYNIALRFDATPEYIKEVKEKYKNIEPSDTDTLNRKDKSRLPREIIKNYKLYNIIRKFEYPDENHENAFYGGIAISKTGNRIVYIYNSFYGDYCQSCYKDKNITNLTVIKK